MIGKKKKKKNWKPCYIIHPEGLKVHVKYCSRCSFITFNKC